jgi:putative FmdB family regulatory protein
MPFYEYRCSECQLQETRISGIDDHTVTCTQCGALMVRITSPLDVLKAYTQQSED